MSTVEYKVLDRDELLTFKDTAPAPAYVSWDDVEKDNPWGFDMGYVGFVYKFVDGIPVEFIGMDGGEPEDQTLSRDWSWVAPALQAAYDDGLADGQKNES